MAKSNLIVAQSRLFEIINCITWFALLKLLCSFILVPGNTTKMVLLV
jgi:hypothetical protein